MSTQHNTTKHNTTPQPYTPCLNTLTDPLPTHHEYWLCLRVCYFHTKYIYRNYYRVRKVGFFLDHENGVVTLCVSYLYLIVACTDHKHISSGPYCYTTVAHCVVVASL